MTSPISHRSNRAFLARVGTVLSVVLALGASSVTSGCRTTEDDVHRWASTAQGPRKLVAVLQHDKYPLDLRVEAAMTLATMKPRGGKRIGIEGSDEFKGLVAALAELPPNERSKIISGMVPPLTEGMAQPPPKAEGEADPSIAYKDAAFAMLTHDERGVVVQDENKKQLQQALIEWASTGFASRMDDSTQMFGMEQVLRELKADGVRSLPALIEPGASKVDRIADLIADLGDEKTKLAASQKLVTIAKRVDSDAWLKEREPSVRAANEASKLSPTPEQFKKQLAQYQQEELLRIFSSMKRVGGEPTVNYLLAYAKDESYEPDRRAAALAALEGHLNARNPEHAAAALALASDEDSPDKVRDVALRRVGEMPRSVVVDKLYDLFESDNWKVRWVAAELILKMSDLTHLDEFMRKLGKTKSMALTEPLRYGTLIGDMKGDSEQAAQKWVSRGNPTPARLAALGYYYKHGTKGELAKLKPFADDRAKVPQCKEDAEDCEWECTIGDEAKEVATVGDYVSYCVMPAMEKMTEADKKRQEQQKESQ